jgi:general stress protein 26|tara:strand:+ start:337 stop:522 length:186 start_codon:yes stop_codon:yes gene_type:complete
MSNEWNTIGKERIADDVYNDNSQKMHAEIVGVMLMLKTHDRDEAIDWIVQQRIDQWYEQGG